MIQLFSLKDVRKKAGMSQQQMAVFLKTSRSQIAMVERGSRSFGIEAIKRLGELEESVRYAGDLQMQERMGLINNNDKMMTELEESWAFKLTIAKYQQRKAEYRLIVMVRMYDDALQAFNSISMLLQQGPGNITTHEQIFHRYQLSEVQRRLSTCNEACQLKVKARIDIYESEAAVLKRFLGDTAGTVQQQTTQQKAS